MIETINNLSNRMTPIDATDRRLLALLRTDARMSVTDLAGHLGVTRLTARNRMQALHAAGVIRRFTVDIAEDAAPQAIRAVSLIEVRGQRAQTVQRQLGRMPEIVSLHSTNGAWALVAQSETESLAAFDAVLNRIGALDGVGDVETCLLLTRLV